MFIKEYFSKLNLLRASVIHGTCLFTVMKSCAFKCDARALRFTGSADKSSTGFKDIVNFLTYIIYRFLQDHHQNLT